MDRLYPVDDPLPALDVAMTPTPCETEACRLQLHLLVDTLAAEEVQALWAVLAAFLLRPTLRVLGLWLCLPTLLI